MAPSLAAIALYPTEAAARAVLETLEREGFVIRQILTAPAPSSTNTSAEGWEDAPAPVGIGLFVSHAAGPTGASVSEDAAHADAAAFQDAPPWDHAATDPGGHIVIVYDQAKEKAIETLASKEPLQLFRY